MRTTPLATAPVALALAALAALAGCGSDQSLANAEPRIQLDVTSIDFGGVNLGTPETVTVTVSNAGTGTLEVESVELTPDTDPTAFEYTTPPDAIRSDSPGTFQVTFIPDQEVPFTGGLRIRSNSVEGSVLDVSLAGTGAVPDLKVTPTSLHFESGGADSATFTLSSEGSGTVIVQDVILFDTEGVFAVAPAPGHQPPFELTTGQSVEVSVAYDGEPGGGPYSGEIWVSSNDLQTPNVRVDLTAEGDDVGSGQPPEVQILSPESGSVVHVGESLTLQGLVSDPDEPAQDLLVWWDSDLDPAITASADATGAVEVITDTLSAGTHTLSLNAMDSAGKVGTTSVRLIVWQEGDTFEYVISGEAGSEYTYFGVDDDLDVWLTTAEGTSLIFHDDSGDLDNLAPIRFEASPGDQIRIVAADVLAAKKRLDAVYLTLVGANAASGAQALNPTRIWVTSYRTSPTEAPDCGEEGEPEWADYDGPCYDPSYFGPWPNDFFDETFVIEVP